MRVSHREVVIVRSVDRSIDLAEVYESAIRDIGHTGIRFDLRSTLIILSLDFPV